MVGVWRRPYWDVSADRPNRHLTVNEATMTSPGWNSRSAGDIDRAEAEVQLRGAVRRHHRELECAARPRPACHAVTSAPTAGKICDCVASSYGQRHIHNRNEAPR